MRNALFAMVLVWWPIYARLLRGQVLAIKHRDHIEAAVSIGAQRDGGSCASTSCRCRITPALVNATHGLRAGRDAHRHAQLLRPRGHAAFARMGRDDHRRGAALLPVVDRRSRPGIAILTVVHRPFNFARRRARDALDVRGQTMSDSVPGREIARSFRGPDPASLDLHVAFAVADGPGARGARARPRGAPGEVVGRRRRVRVGQERLDAGGRSGCSTARRRVTGSARFDGVELLGAADRAAQRSAAAASAMIFQDPMTSLNPVLDDRPPDRRGGHRPPAGRARGRPRRKAVELLDSCRIPEPRGRCDGRTRTSCPAACASG